MDVGTSLTRRHMLRLMASAAATAAVAPSLARAQAAVQAPAALPRSKRPNVLMIVADDHRHDVLGCMGDPTVRTPILDGLAAAGTCFTQAHQMGGKFDAVCVPTRGSLMTGCNVFRAMVNPADNVISRDRVTLGQHFGDNGYLTHIVGKWHNDKETLTRTFQGGEGIFLRGLNTDQYSMRVHHYDPTGAYQNNTVYHAKTFSSDFLADRTIDFLHGNRSEKPFFLYTAFTAPHDPRTPPRQFARMYDPQKVPLPQNFMAQHPFDNGWLGGRDENTAPHPRPPAVVREELAKYYGMVSNMDFNIGRILAALEASGQADNTIVVFTADHGLALGQHGLMGKQNLYDHTLRVPLVLRGPGVPKNQRSDALAYSWDLFPTLCELAGIGAPIGLDAQSLGAVLSGRRSDHRGEVHGLFCDCQRMVKNDRWKLIEYAVKGQRHTQLFDLKQDPWETVNRAGEAASLETLTALRGSLKDFQFACGDVSKSAVAALS